MMYDRGVIVLCGLIALILVLAFLLIRLLVRSLSILTNTQFICKRILKSLNKNESLFNKSLQTLRLLFTKSAFWILRLIAQDDLAGVAGDWLSIHLVDPLNDSYHNLVYEGQTILS